MFTNSLQYSYGTETPQERALENTEFSLKKQKQDIPTSLDRTLPKSKLCHSTVCIGDTTTQTATKRTADQLFYMVPTQSFKSQSDILTFKANHVKLLLLDFCKPKPGNNSLHPDKVFTSEEVERYVMRYQSRKA